jgi:hypothetical protein
VAGCTPSSPGGSHGTPRSPPASRLPARQVTRQPDTPAARALARRRRQPNRPPSRSGASPPGRRATKLVKHQGPPRRTLHKLDCALSGHPPHGRGPARLMIYVETQARGGAPDHRGAEHHQHEPAALHPAGDACVPTPPANPRSITGSTARQPSRTAETDQARKSSTPS